MAAALDEMGYYFNERGELRDKEHEAFKFTTQAQYEKLGDAITEYLYEQMEGRFGMERLAVRPEIDENEPSDYDQYPDESFGFIFASPDYFRKRVLVVLIHGSGAVRAGQLIINENIDEGSQFGYIQNAIDRDWGVLVFNTNDNCRTNADGQRISLPFSNTPNKHSLNAWKRYIQGGHWDEIHVVAHSAGGSNISNIMDDQREDKVKTILLTDSWFSGNIRSAFAINFKCSVISPNSTTGFAREGGRDQFWMPAGTLDHDRSSASCIDAAFYAMENWRDYHSERVAKYIFLAEVANRVRNGSVPSEIYLRNARRKSGSQRNPEPSPSPEYPDRDSD
ncbi:unnamed protein product, partial [Mesorhabditis spiculigera]